MIENTAPSTDNSSMDSSSSSLSSSSSTCSIPLVYRGQKPIALRSANNNGHTNPLVVIDTVTVPDRCFRHYFVEESGDVHFEEGVQEIGTAAFSMCWTLGNIRLPLSVEMIGQEAFAHCMLQTRSFELPPKSITIGGKAFQGCARLRNVALFASPEQPLGKSLFKGCHNLLAIFPDSKSIVNGLMQRFDGLPRHEICYYQSYYSTNDCLQKLEQVAAEESSSSTATNQDCLGMTPLHILALSKTQRLELYQACIQHSPDDLNTPDKWGALPIHYALENNVPFPIAKYLLQQHQMRFPNQTIKLDKFLLSQGVHFFQRASLSLVELVLGQYQQQNSQAEQLDWQRILYDAHSMASLEVFQCVVSKSISSRIQTIEYQPWRNEIQDDIRAISKENLEGECWTPTHEAVRPGIEVVEKIQSKLATYEKRTIMGLVELICWKSRIMAASSPSTNDNDDDIRTNSRIRSGADFIVPLVLSYL